MAFTEKQEYKIEVLENGCLQIRRSDIVLKDGIEVGRQFHRHCLNPGDNTTEEPERVQAVANAVWTKDVVVAYKAQSLVR